MAKVRTMNIHKYIWLTVSLILSVISLRAQDDTNDSSTSLSFNIYGGAVMPTGEFFEQNIGAAKLGFCFGARVIRGTGFFLDAGYISNPTSLTEEITSRGASGTSGNWKSVLALAGLKIGAHTVDRPTFSVAPVLGAVFVWSPKTDYTVTETYSDLIITEHYSTASVSSTALAYGAMIELNAKHVTLGARYVLSRPTFHYSVNHSSSTGVQSIFKGSSTQGMSFIQIIAGYEF
jgi:hypothetical protein